MPRRASVVPVSDLSFSEVSRVAWRYFQSKTGKPKGVLFIPPMNKISLETNKVAFGKIWKLLTFTMAKADLGLYICSLVRNPL